MKLISIKDEHVENSGERCQSSGGEISVSVVDYLLTTPPPTPPSLPPSKEKKEVKLSYLIIIS